MTKGDRQHKAGKRYPHGKHHDPLFTGNFEMDLSQPPGKKARAVGQEGGMPMMRRGKVAPHGETLAW
jgi:hypothetical protein